MDLRKHWRIVFVLFIIAAALIRREEATKILREIIRLSPWVLVAALALEFLELALQAARMWIVFRKDWKTTFKTYVEGLAASLAAPSRTIGEGIRVGITATELNVSGESAGAYVVMERIADVAVLTVSAATFLPLTAFCGILLAVALGLLALEISVFSKIVERMPTFIKKMYYEAQQIARRRKEYLAIILATVTLWIVDYSRLYIILHAMGANAPWITVAGAVAASYLISAITFIPGGLGVYEGGVAAILKLHGTPLSVGLAAVLYERLFSYWLVLLLGGLAGARGRKE